MKRTLPEIHSLAKATAEKAGLSAAAEAIAANCAWLESVGYPGLKLLSGALADTARSAVLEKDALGLDLQNVSCVFLADEVDRLVKQHGRLFLRNVRHGLYLLPASVQANYGIGCPVDPGFPIGMERTKNPYAEKRELAGRDGVEVDDALWQALER